ncbi:hypothetical protein [Paenibacillus oleatilyticus]|uniref:LysR substrate-binding domain-containing protein n=1 Tax=Paenibacillus oleatilyticus TaxID=2594886 RepID=A0ABV4V9H9_9BACL
MVISTSALPSSEPLNNWEYGTAFFAAWCSESPDTGSAPAACLFLARLHVRLQLRTKHGEPILRKSWMIYRKESLHLSLIKAFVDFIKELKLM